jgi:EAL domain-containing protein (putative c-di-GMP-specific phosphodiesterase class I)
MPIAYRTATRINSVVAGVLEARDYAALAEGSQESIDLACWSIGAAMRDLAVFAKAGRNVAFVSVQCPVALAADGHLEEIMKRLIAENACVNPGQICLEFPVSILQNPTPTLHTAMLDMKLMKVKTMMSGCGGADCPTANLLSVPVDRVLLVPAMTQLAGSRGDPTVLPSFMQYLRSMRVEILAEGAENDAQIQILNRADCAGYIAARTYQGAAGRSYRDLTLEQAVAQKEE